MNGIVSDVYFRLGEFVAQGNPILAILPPENVKIRFFVAEKVLPTIHYNQKVFVRYDNAPKEIEAKVLISHQPLNTHLQLFIVCRAAIN